MNYMRLRLKIVYFIVFNEACIEMSIGCTDWHSDESSSLLGVVKVVARKYGKMMMIEIAPDH